MKKIVNPLTSLLFWFSQSLPIAKMLSGVIRAARPEEFKNQLVEFCEDGGRDGN